MTRRRTLQSGVMLFELMVALVLIGLFATAAVQLVHSSLRASREAGEASSLGVRFDAALAQLRRDVWNASRLETPDARTLRIETAEAAPIEWRITDQRALVRVTGTDRQEWAGVVAGLTLATDGSALVLVTPDGRRMPVVSQVMLAEQRRRS